MCPASARARRRGVPSQHQSSHQKSAPCALERLVQREVRVELASGPPSRTPCTGRAGRPGRRGSRRRRVRPPPARSLRLGEARVAAVDRRVDVEPDLEPSPCAQGRSRAGSGYRSRFQSQPFHEYGRPARRRPSARSAPRPGRARALKSVSTRDRVERHALGPEALDERRASRARRRPPAREPDAERLAREQRRGAGERPQVAQRRARSRGRRRTGRGPGSRRRARAAPRSRRPVEQRRARCRRARTSRRATASPRAAAPARRRGRATARQPPSGAGFGPGPRAHASAGRSTRRAGCRRRTAPTRGASAGCMRAGADHPLAAARRSSEARLRRAAGRRSSASRRSSKRPSAAYSRRISDGVIDLEARAAVHHCRRASAARGHGRKARGQGDCGERRGRRARGDDTVPPVLISEVMTPLVAHIPHAEAVFFHRRGG